jgi:TolA-binding protein
MSVARRPLTPTLSPLRGAREPLALVLAVVLGVAPAVAAQDHEGTADLATYYTALSERRLIAAETGSIEELRSEFARAEDLAVDGQHDAAALILYELTESPRFTDFEASDELRNAQYLLSGELAELGAYRSAFRVVERVLAHGPEDPYFGPAYRRAVDIALAGADLPSILDTLETIGEDGLSPDALNELRYLRGRALYDTNDDAGADAEFAQVSRRSRFYANAQYLRGVIATRRGALGEAETLFCSIATTSDTDRFTFYVDHRYFQLRDLTWLALGRVAHEGQRGEDAFYYYFQVPADSDRVSEALFEAAWAMYEGHDADTAVDLLDQLETRFPSSPYVLEASLLRGYVHLDRCEFEEADRLFVRFAEVFEPLRDEVEHILASQARRDSVFEELLAIDAAPAAPPPAEGQAQAAPDLHTILLGLLRVDPTFFRLYSDVRTLDAEAARAARVSDELGAIAVRMHGTDAPEEAVAQVDSEPDQIAALRNDLASARQALRALTEQLDNMRHLGADAARTAPIETTLQNLGEREHALEVSLQQAQASMAAYTNATTGTDVDALLTHDRSFTARFPGRVADVRGRIVGAANAAAIRALEELRDRLGASLRRARIGRIDAVMGSKRRIEIQIESLAAGRFPAELMDPLRIQGLLRDDEEYWPFEGEYWRDEYEEDEATGDDHQVEDLEDAAGETTDPDADLDPDAPDAPAGTAP